MFILPSIGMFHFEPLNVLLNFWLQYEPSYMVVNYQYKKKKKPYRKYKRNNTLHFIGTQESYPWREKFRYLFCTFLLLGCLKVIFQCKFFTDCFFYEMRANCDHKGLRINIEWVWLVLQKLLDHFLHSHAKCFAKFVQMHLFFLEYHCFKQ